MASPLGRCGCAPAESLHARSSAPTTHSPQSTQRNAEEPQATLRRTRPSSLRLSDLCGLRFSDEASPPQSAQRAAEGEAGGPVVALVLPSAFSATSAVGACPTRSLHRRARGGDRGHTSQSLTFISALSATSAVGGCPTRPLHRRERRAAQRERRCPEGKQRSTGLVSPSLRSPRPPRFLLREPNLISPQRAQTEGAEECSCLRQGAVRSG